VGNFRKLKKGDKKMAIYWVQQKATVWQEVQVDADSPEEALKIGTEKIERTGGYEAEDSWEWVDAFWVGNWEREQLLINENE
jgi:hypothetical protein